MVLAENSSLDQEDGGTKLEEFSLIDPDGTTMGEVLLLTSQMPFLVFVSLFLEVFFLNQIGLSKLNVNRFPSALVFFVFEYITIVFPIILIFTLLSDHIALTLLATLIITLVSVICSITSADSHVYYWKLPYSKTEFVTDTTFIGKQPFITYFRSLVFIATTVSILGVDFQIYPRRFAKTESYGVSLMDLGVGLFVVCSGLVKKSSVKKHSQGLLKTSVESFLFLILGLIRYYLVQRFNYQQHVSEYGTHWNFFFTLAFIKLFSYLFMKISRGNNLICGITILLLHQYLLSSSLENYVLGKTERDGWLNANREGIVSLNGYLSLYLIGVAISNFVIPGGTHAKNKLKTLCYLLSIGMCLFSGAYYLNITDCKISRRLANFSYVLWVTALSIILLSITIIIELLCVCFLPVKPHFKTKIYTLITPVMLESINFNGLLFFLISNLLTGLVNLNFDAKNMDISRSILILTIYMVVNCAVVFGFCLVNIPVKLS